MIEERVINYLNREMQVPAYMEEVPNMPEEYVLIDKTGGVVERHINKSTIAIQSIAKTLYNAAALNEKVKKKRKDIIILDDICRCELNSDYNFTDTSTKKYRYQAVYDIIHY